MPSVKMHAGVLADVNNAGLLDLVAAWYVKAARYARGEGFAGATASAAAQPGKVRCAFVSTNSITQGEQVGVLWGWMLAQGVKIQFAPHLPMEQRCQGCGRRALRHRRVWHAEPESDKRDLSTTRTSGVSRWRCRASNINPYLVDAPDVVLPRRNKPLCPVPEVGIGDQAD